MKTLRTLSILFALVAVPSLAIAGKGGDRKADRQARHAEKIAKFDTNRDGKLDDAERARMHDAMTDLRFDKLDTNGNGSISRAEFKAGAELRRDHRGKFGKSGKGMKKGKGKRGHDGKDARRGKPGKNQGQDGRLLGKVKSV